MDNQYKGLGIALGWDARLKRLFITKRDYVIKEDTLNFDPNNGFYVQIDCPEGYTRDGNLCVRTIIEDKVPEGTPLEVIDSTNRLYGPLEPALYSAYNSDGTGNIDIMSPTGYTFEYLADPWWTGDGDPTVDIVNKLGKWISGAAFNTWYGASSLLTLTETKIYYVLLAADNKFRLTVDGVVIITSDDSTMHPQQSPSIVTRSAFERVHIYPISLDAGCRIIKIEGYNTGGAGMFGAAIVNNTDVEIRNATSESDLTFVYSTETETIFYENSLAYSCEDGFTDLDPESNCGQCQRIDTTSGIREIDLGDPEYFDECSWTVAYSPLKNSWISYYSFKPNYYINYNNYFQTGVNFSNDSLEIGLWSHLPFLSSYQVFYGKRYPFIVEYPLVSSGLQSRLDFVEYWLDIRKYYDKYDFADIYNIGFDQAVIYNNKNNSGRLNLIPSQENNLQQKLQYPKHNVNSIDILQAQIHGKYSFNTIYNVVRNEQSGLPIWINDCAQIDKTLNDQLLDYRSNYKDRIRGDYFLVRLSNTLESRYKMLFRYATDSRDYYEQ